MSTPYRSLPGPAREEFIAFTVKDAVNFPLEYTDAMTHLHQQINSRLAVGGHIQQMTQSSTGNVTTISIVFELPAEASQERRHRP